MARMHSKKHGKSKSRKPVIEAGAVPEGLTLSKDQITELALEYARQGLGPELIGEKLKREHGVPYIKQIMGKRLVAVLAEKGHKQAIPSDLMNLIRKAVRINQHMAKNGQDAHNKINLVRTESKIWRLTKYYKSAGALPEGWHYDPKEAVLLVKGRV
ncbi:MAG: 30S ribosomal protein S15 [Candidatus Marsarchaeota archaeon]|jgi:small subunit ribosomal protein S15|nr:30S ribosomal protein S15 [Candidatus Marsarchaeota archaeon]